MIDFLSRRLAAALVTLALATVVVFAVVEVLPGEEYEDEHLPGAINIPLKELNAATVAGLDRARPVIVYCYDYQ